MCVYIYMYTEVSMVRREQGNILYEDYIGTIFNIPFCFTSHLEKFEMYPTP